MESKARPTVPQELRWLRGRARFEGGAIVLDPPVREYSVLKEGEDALWELGAIRRPQDAVDFARRFGLLHHGSDAEDLREPWTDWESTALHIHSLLVTVNSLRAARWGNDHEASEYIRRITSTPEWRGLWQAPARTDAERWAQVGSWVASMVSQGLAGIEFGIESEVRFLMDGKKPGPPDLFVYAPRPSDLLGWIYYTLAQTLVGARPTRRCEGCGVIFLVHDDRQRFHDKRCAQRARYHRAADRRRQGQ